MDSANRWEEEGIYSLAGKAYGPFSLVVDEIDGLGRTTHTEYDAFNYLPISVTDGSLLVRRASYDYRFGLARRIADANENETLIEYTPLGLPEIIVQLGGSRLNEGDSKEHPTSRYEYGLNAYEAGGQPIWTRTLQYKHFEREWLTDHHTTTANLFPDCEVIEYSDGSGRLLQKRERTDSGNYIVNGWQRYDSRGRVVERFEPFFADNFAYQPPEDVRSLVSEKIGYDPRGIERQRQHADGSIEIVVPGIPNYISNPATFAPTVWESYYYDANDNAGRANPRQVAVPASHLDTPKSSVRDGLGRTIRESRRTEQGTFTTSIIYDEQGNACCLKDESGESIQQSEYDLLGRPWRLTRRDCGSVLTILDAAGGVIERYDARGGYTCTGYDRLHRRRVSLVSPYGPKTAICEELFIYGDDEDLGGIGVNRQGRLAEAYDATGCTEYEAYDVGGKWIIQSCRFIATGELLRRVSAARVGWNPVQPDEDVLDPSEYRSCRQFDPRGNRQVLRIP